MTRGRLAFAGNSRAGDAEVSEYLPPGKKCGAVQLMLPLAATTPSEYSMALRPPFLPIDFQATSTACLPSVVANRAAVGEVLVKAPGMTLVACHVPFSRYLYCTLSLNWPFQARKVPSWPFTWIWDRAGVVFVKACGTAGLCRDQGDVDVARAAPAAASAQTVPAATATANHAFERWSIVDPRVL